MNLKEKIEALEKELAEMREKLEQSKKPYGWMTEMKYGDNYYSIDSWGIVVYVSYTNPGAVESKLEMGNVYQTRELATKARDSQRAKVRIINALREHEGDWVADWSGTLNKYYCFYDHGIKKTVIDCRCYVQAVESQMYSTLDAWQWVIDNMANDVKLYLGIK